MGDGLARVRGATVLAVLGAALAVTPASGGACSAYPRLADGWTRIPAPALSVGPAALAAYDVADYATGKVVTTNGAAIAATVDAGCTWVESTIEADQLPDPTVGEQALSGRSIRQVRFSTGVSDVLWAIGDRYVVNGGVVSPQPRVLYSHDAGTTFAVATGDLPPVGRPLAVRGSGAKGAWVLFEESLPGKSYSLYVTVDAGVSWTLLWEKVPEPVDFTVDVFHNGRIWAWGEHGLYHGLGVGGGPTRVDAIPGGVSAVAVDGLSGTVTAFLSGGAERFVSYDTGITFSRTPSPEAVESASSVTLTPGLPVLATSSLETNVLVEPPPVTGRKAVDFSPHEENVSEVQFEGGADTTGFPLWALSPTALYRRVVPFDFAAPPPREQPKIDVDVRRRAVDRRAPAITPADNVVTLQQGQRKVVDYTVALPAIPTPLDVFFMTDSTGSMSTTIASVQEGVQGIIDGLTDAGVDLYFGVADFRDYPEMSPTAPQQNHAYRLLRKVGPVNVDLADALESIDTGGGTTDGDDSALEAIYQGATGAGRTDPLLARGELIAPDQDAGFRDDAMKVILVATDDGMRQPGANPGYPGPNLETVKSALVERDIHLVGLEVQTSSGDSARDEMEELANATGAVAPDKGVDCDGDGAEDILGNEPLVCEFAPDGGGYVADAFVNMLYGIEDIAAVDLTVSGPTPVVRPKGPTHFGSVNVKAPNTFTLPVEFVCGPGNAGVRTPVRIAARSRGAEVVATTATLDCVAPDPPPHVEIPPAILAPVVVPAAPIAPISNPQPPVNTNPNPNPQLNPNAGMAAQEDHELQLAIANQEGVLPDEDLAMTGLDRAGPPVPALAWATALAMTGAAAFGLHRSRRTSPAPVLVGRRSSV